MRSLFKNDNTLDISFEVGFFPTVIYIFNQLIIHFKVMKKISKLLKQRSFGVKPEVLNTMLDLNLKEIKIIEEDKKKLTHKEKMKLSRTERKVQTIR